jgi:Type II secretion system (T2SS), protein E, N-terminal domain
MTTPTIDVYKTWLGIPDGPRPPGHYVLLRLVEFEDNVDKIKGNYKKLNAHVRKYASGTYSLRSQELLNELAKAMLCLTDPERKREYDESLGRVFEDATSAGPKSVGQVLVSRKVITPPQLKEADHFAEARGLSLRDALVQMKLVESGPAAEALAESLGRPFLDLADVVPDEDVLDRVPRSTVKRYSSVPLFTDDDQVLVACVDEPPHELEEEIRLRVGLPMRPVITTPTAIKAYIAKYYAPGMRDTAPDPQPASAGPGAKTKTTRTTEKATGSKAKKQKTARPPFRKLSPEEQRWRRQLGIIIMIWGLIPCVLIDRFVLFQRVFPYYHPKLFFLAWFPFTSFLVTLIIPPIVVLWVVLVFWK